MTEPTTHLANLRVGLKNRMVLGHTPDIDARLAEYDAAVRAAAFTEAAEVAVNVTHVPGGAAYAAGYLDARDEIATELRRLAAAPTATAPTPAASSS